jgi:hypothetical protein
MALIEANGQPVLEALGRRRRVGAWRFDLLVDDPEALAGKVTLDVNGGAMTFVGTAVRSAVFSDTNHVQLIAGNGGLNTPGTPRHYNGTTVGGVLSDLLGDAREALSATADASVLGQPLAAWTTAATPVATLIGLLLAAGSPGAVWRSLPDGTVWVGNETWPDAGIDSSLYQVFEDNAENSSMLVGCDAPFLLPGTTFEGRKVSYVEDIVGQEGKGVSTRIFFEDDGGTGDMDRVRAAMFALAQQAASRTGVIDYSRKYPATVVSQAGNLIDVQPELVNGKPLLGDMGSVPLWLGVPGARVSGIEGGRVMVGWSGGDPSAPYATLFDGGETPDTLTLLATTLLALGGPGGQPPMLGGPTMNYLGLLATAINAIVPGSVPPPDPSLLATKVTVV